MIMIILFLIAFLVSIGLAISASSVQTLPFCNPEPIVFTSGVFYQSGFLSFQCNANECTKTCATGDNVCNSNVLNATNISSILSGSIETIKEEQNNIILLVNCSKKTLVCDYVSSSLSTNAIIQPESIYLAELTAPTSTITYDCVEQ